MLAVNEMLAQYGAGVLSTNQLLTVILGNGAAVEKLMQDSCDPLRMLQSDIQMLEGRGLTKLQAQKIAAVVELAARYNTSRGNLHGMTCPDEIYQYLRPHMAFLQQEHFTVLALNSKNKLIAAKTVSVGSLTAAVVHPRDVFRVAIEHNAASIIVAHNHPSGDPQPSREDHEITKMLKAAGQTMGIPVLDHIIVGESCYYSFMNNNAM